MRVLKALLWGFHNSQSGLCFPGYEAIAERAKCCRATVYEAIRALEAAGVVSWVNRLVRVQFRALDIFGKMALHSRVIRTSNAYSFRDPSALAEVNASKSENSPRTINQDSYKPSSVTPDPNSALEQALARLKTNIEAIKP
jgi:hypothetical protein